MARPSAALNQTHWVTHAKTLALIGPLIVASLFHRHGAEYSVSRIFLSSLALTQSPPAVVVVNPFRLVLSLASLSEMIGISALHPRST